MEQAADEAGRGPMVREVTEGPAALTLTHAYRWFVWSTRCRSALADVVGGLEAGQHGMATLQARAALEAGIDIYLAANGRFFVPDAYRWSTLAEVRGQDGAIYQEAWGLECENPDTPEALSSYAQRCRQFVEDRLGVSEPAARSTPEDLTTFDRVLVDIATLAALLGIDSPLSGTRFNVRGTRDARAGASGPGA